MQVDERMLEDIIRKILREEMGGTSPPMEKKVDPRSGILSVKGPSVVCAPFDTGKPGDKVYLSDILTLEESPRIMAGMMEMDHSSFDWTLEYDEVDYIIEGVLEIKTGTEVLRGEAGDVLFIPKGSSITFMAPGKTRFLYVTYPANWSEQG